MISVRSSLSLSRRLTRHFAASASLAAMLCAAPAFSGESGAETALNRADAKIEMVTRQAGQAGDGGDQTFNMARQRVLDAHAAQNSNDYDTAEMLADEASLLADLTGEKAILAALKTSHADLERSTNAIPVSQ